MMPFGPSGGAFPPNGWDYSPAGAPAPPPQLRTAPPSAPIPHSAGPSIGDAPAGSSGDDAGETARGGG
eukprot:CAMPEP_0172159526 /NCGR_PEP_ID=MMETSP1050-20130122/5020_1 /TAXON_ID=233186 /ORGANISM="Cryptomonas curvata, Strain CCAP979/52" /LENGTH=67 /DNA_ID=CAMNT_0012829125 /DNA_START=209 /DNA_END=408 /DNA_ORIENTATION=+